MISDERVMMESVGEAADVRGESGSPGQPYGERDRRRQPAMPDRSLPPVHRYAVWVMW
jgi:hypothetical protein